MSWLPTQYAYFAWQSMKVCASCAQFVGRALLPVETSPWFETGKSARLTWRAHTSRVAGIASIFAALLVISSSAIAADPAAQLADRVESLESEIRQLRQVMSSDYRTVSHPGLESGHTVEGWHTPVGETSPPVYEIAPVEECLECVSYPTVGFTGLMQTDTAYFHQSANNRATIGDAQDGISFRRVRLAAHGQVAANTSYLLEIDFAASQPRFVDVWFNFSNVPVLGNVRIGRWRQPFGMDELTSVKEIPFLERATPFPLGPFRQTGIGFFNHSANERVTWALSGYRYPTLAFGNATGDNGGWGLAGRATALPYYECDGDFLVHLGFAYSFNDPGRDRIAYAKVPGVFTGESRGGLLPAPFDGVPFFASTGLIPTDDVSNFGLEAAAAVGRLYLQSEMRWTVVDMMNGSTQTFPDAYAQARYVLTGEKIPYKKAEGVFGRVTPHEDVDFHGGRGAWEVAARWSYIDLNGTGLPGPGRRMNDLTLGLNWYLNKYTKLQLNYIHAFLNDRTLGDSEASIVAARAHLDF